MNKINKKICLPLMTLCTLFLALDVNAETKVDIEIVENKSIIYIDSNNSGTMNVGDEIIIGGESFYCIGFKDGSGEYMAKYNLDTTTMTQSATDAYKMINTLYDAKTEYEQYKAKLEANGIKIKSIAHPSMGGLLACGCENRGTSGSLGDKNYSCINALPFVYEQEYIIGSTGLWMEDTGWVSNYKSPAYRIGFRPAITLERSEYKTYNVYLDGEKILTTGKNNVIKLTITPEEGKEVKNIKLINRLTNEEFGVDENNQFSMPESDVDLVIEYDDKSGDNGDNGDNGNNGDNGDNGDNGNNGDNGDNGNNGDNGDNENTGDKTESGNSENVGNKVHNTNFTENIKNPNTGDNIYIYIIELIISLHIMLFSVKDLKNKQK